MNTVQIKETLERYFDEFYNIDINDLPTLLHETAYTYSRDETGALENSNK